MPVHHHAGCEHEHDHDEPGGGILYSRIDRDNVVALNEAEPGSGKLVIKPWDRRNDTTEYLESDADEQLILRVPFTGSIKLRSIIVKGGSATDGPTEIRIFANATLDFDDIAGKEPTQVVELAASHDCIEYPVRTTKFTAVRHLSLFFPGNFAGGDVTRIDFVGFKGDFTEIRDEAVVTVYEAQPNPADHVKIPGLDGMMSSNPG